ncbi:MAG: sigma-70 family RNA polymerase sigma factor [Armatimonadota bacterium]|nr:sigma-70 family RNA polymerase sigma factor [Armatimonadota bacterium]
MEQELRNLKGIVSLAIQRTKHWLLPPNWEEHQWFEELDAVAWEAAWEAICTFEPNKNVPLQVFVFLQVKKALKDFYRREWAYACHCVSPHQTEDEEGSENWEFALLSQEQEEKAFRETLLRWALSQLSQKERLVIERLYWDGWTEAEIAQGLGISQQAVSKIKGQALKKLKELLS